VTQEYRQLGVTLTLNVILIVKQFENEFKFQMKTMFTPYKASVVIQFNGIL